MTKQYIEITANILLSMAGDIYPWRSLNYIKKITVCRVAIFLNEAVRQTYFLGIYEIFNITNSSNPDC